MRFLRRLAVLALVAIVLAGCGEAVATPTSGRTAVPIGPTAWPSGTTGQYGLRIDPSLLAKLPAHAGALPIVEDAGSESSVLGDAAAANTLDRYVAASAGEVSDPDWVKISLGHFKTESQNADVYSAWVDQYAKGGCSQAGGVAGTTQQTIGDWLVDVSNCNGAVTVYTLQRGDWVVLSMYDFGPKDIGRQLITALY
jgi:hypothetical protein